MNITKPVLTKRWAGYALGLHFLPKGKSFINPARVVYDREDADKILAEVYGYEPEDFDPHELMNTIKAHDRTTHGTWIVLPPKTIRAFGAVRTEITFLRKLKR